MAYKIEKFVPFRFDKFDLDKIELNKLLGKQMRYASCGKAALYHCMLSLGMHAGDKILVPNYICSSVLVPIEKLRIKPVFYDINELDLNANIDSIKWNKENDPSIKAVLVASMYGNPADLVAIEQYCKENQLLLIDDAAQSLGAIINGRYVGTFGDAGFFSFSPGKATPGHLGAFYWTFNNTYSIQEKNHFFYHYIAYLSYYFNRYEIYKYQKNIFRRLVKYAEVFAKKYTDYWNDKVNDFEKPILGGILHENFAQTFRKEFSYKFNKEFENTDIFRVITRGSLDTNNHKLVVLCKTAGTATALISHLEEKKISTINGYSLLDNNANTPIARSVEKRVIEIPLEDDFRKFSYIIESIRSFLNINSNQHK